MTADEFRELALGFPGAVESAQVNHPDFRKNGSIFATLGYPDSRWAMVKLTPEEQRRFTTEAPDVFGPCRGTWGKRGATHVRLELAERPLLTTAIAAAFEGLAARPQRKDS